MTNKNWEAIPTKTIVNNVKLVYKTGEIDKLSKTAYRFIMNMPNFIAHYDLTGFQWEYQNVNKLAEEIIQSTTGTPAEYWSDQWFNKEYGEVYCKSKTDTINQLTDLSKLYVNNQL